MHVQVVGSRYDRYILERGTHGVRVVSVRFELVLARQVHRVVDLHVVGQPRVHERAAAQMHTLSFLLMKLYLRPTYTEGEYIKNTHCLRLCST